MKLPKNNPIRHRRLYLEIFEMVIKEIRKCAKCRRNKTLERNLNRLMTKVLYEKRLK